MAKKEKPLEPAKSFNEVAERTHLNVGDVIRFAHTGRGLSPKHQQAIMECVGGTAGWSQLTMSAQPA